MKHAALTKNDEFSLGISKSSFPQRFIINKIAFKNRQDLDDSDWGKLKVLYGKQQILESVD